MISTTSTATTTEALSLEEASIRQGQQRVKFRTEYVAGIQSPKPEEWGPLARALEVSEKLGAAPVCPIEGYVFGNGAILSQAATSTTSQSSAMSESIVVSKSGRYAGTEYTKSQFVRVVDFNNDTWQATYGGADDGEDDDNNINSSKGNNNDAKVIIKPSSDTPLLWNALIVAPAKFQWDVKPRFVLHGHSCSTELEARKRGFPCSNKETLFSTPDDLHQLMALFEKYPYPKHQVYVRKQHGFFLLAQNEEEACDVFRTKICNEK